MSHGRASSEQSDLAAQHVAISETPRRRPCSPCGGGIVAAERGAAERGAADGDGGRVALVLALPAGFSLAFLYWPQLDNILASQPLLSSLLSGGASGHRLA